jgi:hypothetical protein
MAIHFPIAYAFLIFFIESKKLKDGVTAETDKISMVEIGFLLSLLLTNIAGRVTLSNIGLLIDDASWAVENLEIANLVLTHRSWGNLCTIYWVLLFLTKTPFFKKKFSIKSKYFYFVGSFIGVVLISITALIGSHIGR